jgi:hypothetical protein
MERKGNRLDKRTDAVVYSTADHKKLARAAIFIQETGVHLRSISETIRIIMDTFDDWLDKKGIPTIETTHEATAILQHMFRASLNPGDRKKKTLLENLQKDEELDFDPLPKPRGRQPNWTEADAERMRLVAEKSLMTPKMQELLKQYGKEETSD